MLLLIAKKAFDQKGHKKTKATQGELEKAGTGAGHHGAGQRAAAVSFRAQITDEPAPTLVGQQITAFQLGARGPRKNDQNRGSRGQGGANH